MRKAFDRSLNLDLFDDQWLWLQSTEPLEEEVAPWTDEEILHICESLLEDSLRNLFDLRCSNKTIFEIYKWLTDTQDQNAFSFVNCCELTGLDHEEVRDSIVSRFKKLRRSLH